MKRKTITIRLDIEIDGRDLTTDELTDAINSRLTGVASEEFGLDDEWALFFCGLEVKP